MRTVLFSWLLTLLFSMRFLGDFLGRRLEGRNLESAELAILALVVASIAISVALTVRAFAPPGGRDEDGAPAAPDRRRFLGAAAASVAGVAASLAAAVWPNRGWTTVTIPRIFAVRPEYRSEVRRDAWVGARVQGYRRLGRTGAMVSDISLGSGSSTGGRQTVDVTREAIDRGINYFDTAPDYAETGSERRFGEAMKGRRDQMFVATKFCVPTGHLGPGTPVEGYMRAVEGSLERLQTD